MPASASTGAGRGGARRRPTERARAPVIMAGMSGSKAQLPKGVRPPFEVYINGVPQTPGEDFNVREGALIFNKELRKDKISGWRWLLGAWGVGTYRQNDSVDVRYEAADGSPRVAEGLEIEPA